MDIIKIIRGIVMRDLDIVDCIYDTLNEKLEDTFSINTIETLAKDICTRLNICEKCGQPL